MNEGIGSSSLEFMDYRLKVLKKNLTKTLAYILLSNYYTSDNFCFLEIYRINKNI